MMLFDGSQDIPKYFVFIQINLLKLLEQLKTFIGYMTLHLKDDHNRMESQRGTSRPLLKAQDLYWQLQEWFKLGGHGLPDNFASPETYKSSTATALGTADINAAIGHDIISIWLRSLLLANTCKF